MVVAVTVVAAVANDVQSLSCDGVLLPARAVYVAVDLWLLLLLQWTKTLLLLLLLL